ncbi:Asp23/Gls24 family envelope stress response protein [Floccifex sp.]|uniref:Asp23/Gls24 family envelope stress response protein n=1 Tax=Floccifex sp. TaxID=2815810 RepID=UPI003EFD9FB7
MAQEYIVLESSNELGKVQLNKSVFSSIAQNVIEEDENVRLVDTRTKNGIVTRIENNGLNLKVSIKINHKANVSDVCSQLQNKIFESISYMTELKPESIEIEVVGFIF